MADESSEASENGEFDEISASMTVHSSLYTRRPPVTTPQLQSLSLFAKKYPQSSDLIYSFLQVCRNGTMKQADATIVLKLIEKDRVFARNAAHDNDLTVEDMVSLLNLGYKPTNRATSLTLRAIVGAREDMKCVPRMLLQKWMSGQTDNDTRNQLGWYFRPVHNDTAVVRQNRDIWETRLPKMVYMTLPYDCSTCEIMAVCTVLTSQCNVMLYGAGIQNKELKETLRKLMEQLERVFSRVFAEDAGRYAWWDRNRQGHFDFNIFSFSEETDPSDQSAPSMHIYDVATKIVEGTFEELFLFGRLSRMDQSFGRLSKMDQGFVPPGAGPVDLESVRELCTRKSFYSAGTDHKLSRSSKKVDRAMNQHEPADSPGLRNLAVNSGIDTEVSRIETVLESDVEDDSLEDDGSGDEIELFDLQEEAVVAIEESQDPGAEDVSDGQPTVPRYSETEIEQRIDDLAKQYDKEFFQLTAEDDFQSGKS